MSVHTIIVDGPLPPAAGGAHEKDPTGSVGSLLVFEGIVRRMEGDREIIALSYEAYEPMASRQLAKLAEEMVARHALASIRVEHSRGVIPVGHVSLRVTMESAHRGASLAAMAEFIELLKKDVPIWKMPVWRGEG